MLGRTLHYYQAIVEPGFDKHMIEQTGLTADQQKIAWDFRRHTGDTDFYAQHARMPVKRFNAVAANIHMRMMGELLRLAQIGWRAEQNNLK